MIGTLAGVRRWAHVIGGALVAALVLTAGGTASRGTQGSVEAGRVLAAVKTFLPQGGKITGGGEVGPR